MVYGSLTDQDE